MSNDTIQYHIGLSKNMIEGAEYVLLPGDPGRVESLAKAFDPNAKFLADQRAHASYLADFHGQKVLVTSSGLGGPSVGIAVEELASIGLKNFLRIGTCGGIQSFTEIGDIIISSGAVRLEGTSDDYAPIEYPAVPSIEFTSSIIDGAKKAGLAYHVGITASTDTFWPAQERYDNFSKYLLRRHRESMAEWRMLNVLNFEMEASALFVMCSCFKLNAACLCSVVAKRTDSEIPDRDAKQTSAKDNWEKAAIHGIYMDMVRNGLIKEKV